MKLATDMDFVEFYAKKLKEDKRHFEQQKIIIESQMESSAALFRKLFGEGEEFKANAREYLRKMGII